MKEITVLELKGYKSLRALNAFHTLMLGLKMLPEYMAEGYEEFMTRVSKMSPEEQKQMIKTAVLFVELSKEEVEALICFTVDPNGVPYTAVNLKSLSADELHAIIVAVCFEISKIKVDFLTEAEKKNKEFYCRR